MKTEQEIRQVIKQCEKAQKVWNTNKVKCPIWPKDEDLYCHDCSCRFTLKWVLEEK